MDILKDFLRSFRVNKQTYSINMLSLIPGLVCCLLILVWIMHEVSTDRFFSEIDRIVTVNGYHEGNEPFGGAPPAVAPVLKQEMPEVVASSRFCYAYSSVKSEERQYDFSSVYADPDLFRVLSLQFMDGQPFSGNETDKCVLFESVAKALFGNASPIGKFLEFGGEKLSVSGVIKDLPKNTTVHLEGLILPINRMGEENLSAWYNNSFRTYVLLSDAGKFPAFKEKIKDRAMQVRPENKLYLTSFSLKDRYLYQWGNIDYILLMGTIVFFILIIACINFVNLVTAGFLRNSFQTGVRKIVGATRKRLICSNFANTLFLVLLSFILAFIISIVVLPWFNLFIGSNFVIGDLLTPSVFGLGIGIIVVTTLIAGTYPAFFISSFNPLKVLRGHQGTGNRKSWFRNSLVVIQFTIAITLIICTLMVSKQIRMYHHLNIGYDRQEVMYVLLNDELKKNVVAFKSELLQEPAVKAVTISQTRPTGINWNGPGWNWEGRDPAVVPLVWFTYVDEDWAKVLGVKFKEGGFFTQDNRGIVINMKMAEIMGGTSWVDRYIDRGDENMKITGLLDNFQYNNFKMPSTPLVIRRIDDKTIGLANCVMLKVERKDLAGIYDFVREKAKELGGKPSVVGFLDDDVENLLYAEKQTSRMVSFFSGLAVLISCLGLFGLATFVTEQRRKEIGIRRVNGAKVGEIVWLLNVSFIKPVCVGFLIACPLGYYFMSRWLEGYLQRTELTLWIFIIAGIIATAIALVTIAWRSISAAVENPVKSLRSE